MQNTLIDMPLDRLERYAGGLPVSIRRLRVAGSLVKLLIRMADLVGRTFTYVEPLFRMSMRTNEVVGWLCCSLSHGASHWWNDHLHG